MSDFDKNSRKVQEQGNGVRVIWSVMLLCLKPLSSMLSTGCAHGLLVIPAIRLDHLLSFSSVHRCELGFFVLLEKQC